MDGWQILGGDAKRQLHVTTNLLRELDASANFKDGCHLRLGGFAWPIQYIKKNMKFCSSQNVQPRMRLLTKKTCFTNWRTCYLIKCYR